VSYDFRAQRLFVEAGLQEGAEVEAEGKQAHYLANVLRMRAGDALLLFNGRDGEWRARVEKVVKRSVLLRAEAPTRAQPPAPDLHYLFAPLKQARLDYMVEKAVEMGVGRLRPVLTRRGQVRSVNPERLRAHAIEAAEQCGILCLPAIDDIRPLGAVLDGWGREPGTEGRRLVWCDEGSAVADPIAALRALGPGPLALLIGPEGGFAPLERERLAGSPFVAAISLGPRVLRADTVAVAALAILQATLGDWRG